MTSRLYDRLAAVLSLTLLGALAVFTFYLAELTERATPAETRRTAHTNAPDYFVERLALSTMNAQGQPALRIQARRLQHQPLDDSTNFESPVLVSLDPNRARLTATAEQGTLSADSAQAYLTGHVQIIQEGQNARAPLEIQTEAATLLPKQGIVQTERAVKIQHGNYQLSGVGMAFNHRDRQLRVDSRVQAVWTPTASSKRTAPRF